MNLIQTIQEIIHNAAKGKTEASEGVGFSAESPAASQDPEPFREIMEGMGSGTARIVIDKEATHDRLRYQHPRLWQKKL